MHGNFSIIPMIFLLVAAALTAFASMSGYLLLGVQGAIEGAKIGLVIAFLVLAVMGVVFARLWKIRGETASGLSATRRMLEEIVEGVRNHGFVIDSGRYDIQYTIGLMQTWNHPEL